MKPQPKKNARFFAFILNLKSLIVICCLWSISPASGQDPNFSQFFSSPLNVNPALTGNINSEWRAISNIRHQWAGPAMPYNTGTISYDRKVLENRIPETAILGIGSMLMYDRVMDGALTSNYASLNVSYNLQVAEDYNGGVHRIGLAIGGIYGNRRVDYGKLTFGEQFNGYGFDTNLPTGENSLSQMKPYFSSSAGLLYTYSTETSNFDLGVSGFHLNKPKQTFIEDDNAVLPVRYVAHMNYEVNLNDYLFLNTNAVFQKQSTASYYSVGGAIGYKLEEENVIVNAGLWYWSKNAIIPYVGFAYKDFQIGMSYDITISKLNTASVKPRSWELSLIIRGGDAENSNRKKGIIPCPWK